MDPIESSIAIKDEGVSLEKKTFPKLFVKVERASDRGYWLDVEWWGEGIGSLLRGHSFFLRGEDLRHSGEVSWFLFFYCNN
jgi:hypothetical protein